MDRLTDISYIKQLIASYGFTFSKGLGQNFIVNSAVLKKIVLNAIPNANYGVIEIGAGIGCLTNYLSLNCSKVVVIEIDRSLAPILNETLCNRKNVSIIYDDFLNINVDNLFKEFFDGLEVCVCANLPYYISSAIITKLLFSKLPISQITIMLQKELANRICAKPGSKQIGGITHIVNYYSSPKLLFNVSKNNFIPVPKVDSSIVQLDLSKSCSELVEDESFLFKVIKAGFNQRRKTLLNSVSNVLQIDKSSLANLFNYLCIDTNLRAETLDLHDFITLSNEIIYNKLIK